MKEMLASLQKQTYQHFNIIINDDTRSTDNLEKQVYADFPDWDIKVIHDNHAV